MAYYLGRDVSVALTTEATDYGLASVSGVLTTFDTDEGPANAVDLVIGGGREQPVFGTVPGTTRAYSNEISDLTGVDLSIGTIDEDITYMGQRSVLKAEIKKETTITLTMKKSDSRWDLAFNGTGSNSGRYGIKEGGASFQSGLEDPGVADFGYRLYIKLNSGEYFMAPNCCLQSHTVTLNSDGTTEETLEFMTYLDPIISSAVGADTVADAGAF